jgi:tetratricopeptide (TPR) repeat protein
MTEGTSQESIKLGHAARRAGRFDEALEQYRSALMSEPDSAEANSVYGMMLLKLDRADEAESALRRAVEISPSHAAFRMNLAQLLAHQKKLDEAVQLVAAVAADEPESWWAWDRLGDLQVRLRNFGDAAAHFGRAAGFRPSDASILFKWARSSFDSGSVDTAERILQNAAKLAPDHEAIYRLGAEIFESQTKWGTLEKLATEWARLDPKCADAWRWLAKAQWETGNLRQAMQSFRTSFDLGGRDATNLATFGRLCLYALDLESAATALDEAEALDANNSHMLSAKAVLMMWYGRHGEAETYCRRSLRVDSDDASAFKTLTHLLNGRLPEEDLAALRLLAERGDKRIQDRITVAFALAECLEARGEIDEAFAAYDRANRLAFERAEGEGIHYDPAERTRQMDELISIFDSVPAHLAGRSEPRPIFIVGMPRSGTTLIESVIGTHSKVLACGERPAMRRIMQEFLSGARSLSPAVVSENMLMQWREFYWRGIPELRDATVVTDKNPWNFDALGLILRLFPDARIVHVRRNPVETGFSIFRNEFSKRVRFTHRLEDIGHYYGEYARVMAHWERVAGDRFTTVQYEEFIERFDIASPALLAACGLDWEESCRNFWRNDRVIATMSTMQARRPLGKPTNRAQLYAAHLLPLVDSLEASGVDLETGAIRSSPLLDANRVRLV